MISVGTELSKIQSTKKKSTSFETVNTGQLYIFRAFCIEGSSSVGSLRFCRLFFFREKLVMSAPIYINLLTQRLQRRI